MDFKFEIKKKPASQIEINGEISFEQISKFEKKALKNFNEIIEIDGFRKGHIPDDILKKHVDEIKLIEEMFSLAFPEIYTQIIEKENLKPLGSPQVLITKIGWGIPIEFKIITSIFPEFELPDYKKIAKEILKKNPREKIIIEPEEVTKSIEELKKQFLLSKENSNLELAQKIGFTSEEELKKKIEEGLIIQKENFQREKIRSKILEEIIKKTNIEIPPLILENEINRIIAQLKNDLLMNNLKFEDYLKEINKKEEDLRNDFKELALKRAKIGFILIKIAELENITPSLEEVEKKTKEISKIYSNLENEKIRAYVEDVLTNEAVISFLENLNSIEN